MTLADTHPKLQQGQGFASLKLVDDFLMNGNLPKIHDAMGKAMEMVPIISRRGALDLGACHGLLSIRAGYLGFSHSHGIEIDAPTVKVFEDYIRPKTNPSMFTMEAKRLDVRSPEFNAWMRETCGRWRINTVLARRALPELFSDTYGKEGLSFDVACANGRLFSEAALGAGVEFIVVEGRQWKGRDNLSNPLYRVDNEVLALGSGWREIGRYKECVVLQAGR